MLERFTKAISRVTQAAAGNEIFSEEGKKFLRTLLKQIKEEIAALEAVDSSFLSSSASSSSSASAISDVSAVEEQQEALKILLKVKALLGKLSSLNSWDLIALGVLEPATIDANKPIAVLTLEELVQDLLLNRDIYWEVKNRFLKLDSLFDSLAKFEEGYFSAAGQGVLHTIGGLEKIHAIGIILSSLSAFYAGTQVYEGINNCQYYPFIDRKLVENFRDSLVTSQKKFLADIRNAKTLEERKRLRDQYQKSYQTEGMIFLKIMIMFPGEAIFLETHQTFRKDSIRCFRPQWENLRSLLEIEFLLNAELVENLADFLENKPLLGTVYNYILGVIDQNAVHARREILFSMVTKLILEPFQEYIDINKNNEDLSKEKANLLQQFLKGVIYRSEFLFNKDGKQRTVDNYGEGKLYTCAEIARTLLVELIAVLKVHDQKCRVANRGVGRTGILLAGAIKGVVEYLLLPYERHLDDIFLSTLSTYRDRLSQLSPKLAASSSSQKGKEAEFIEVSLEPSPSGISFRT